MLRREGVAVSLFATGSNWDKATLDEVRQWGVRFIMPPTALHSARKLAALYSRLIWPMRISGRANSLYCIGAGRSQLLLHRLRPRGSVSINHEIVAPPGADSPAGECARELDATVANSRAVARMMQALWPQKPMRVIPFLTSDAPRPSPGTRSPRPSGPLRVVYLGRLVEQKRPDQLVRRWPILSAHPSLAGARLDLHGHDPEGKMLSELRRWVADARLDGRIRVHGAYKLNELPGILRDCDLVVLPSLWEGLPLVLVEAMSHGVPIVATAAGGTEELGDHNPDVIITRTEWEDFEAGLVKMAERVRSGGIDARRLHAWAEERYGYAAVSRQWLNCLQAPREFFGLHD